MKVWAVVAEMKDFPTEIKIFSSFKKAKNYFYCYIGSIVADYIMNEDIDGAHQYIEKIRNGSESNLPYFYSESEELYIEECEVDSE